MVNKKPFVFLVQPLLNNEDQYGLLINSVVKDDSTLYGPIKEQLSNSIRTININSEQLTLFAIYIDDQYIL